MVTCRFLGRSCIELKGMEDHVIIDPNYSIEPLNEIKTIFFTHEHEDHVNIEKIDEIQQKYAVKENNLEIYGPKSVKNKFDLEITRIKNGNKIKLKDFIIEAHEIDCYKSKECLAYLITKGDIKLLHTADSSNFSKELMNLKGQIDYCFIACFESEFSNYLDFLKEINPIITFPYHFDPGQEKMAQKLSDFLNEHGVYSKFIEIGTEFEF